MNRKIQVSSQIAAQPALMQVTFSYLLRWFFLATGMVTAIFRYDCVSDGTESSSAEISMSLETTVKMKKKKKGSYGSKMLMTCSTWKSRELESSIGHYSWQRDYCTCKANTLYIKFFFRKEIFSSNSNDELHYQWEVLTDPRAHLIKYPNL